MPRYGTLFDWHFMAVLMSFAPLCAHPPRQAPLARLCAFVPAGLVCITSCNL